MYRLCSRMFVKSASQAAGDVGRERGSREEGDTVVPILAARLHGGGAKVDTHNCTGSLMPIITLCIYIYGSISDGWIHSLVPILPLYRYLYLYG
jgi:hypothetical protein